MGQYHVEPAIIDVVHVQALVLTVILVRTLLETHQRHSAYVKRGIFRWLQMSYVINVIKHYVNLARGLLIVAIHVLIPLEIL